MTIGYRLVRGIGLGVKNLLLHRLRSALTMLGIIFGVSSVISMLAIGEGMSHEAQEAIRRLGSTNIIINAVKPADERRAANSGRSFVIEYGLTYEDLARCASTIPGLRKIEPVRVLRDDVAYGDRRVPCQALGVLPSYEHFLPEPVQRGRFLSAVDERNRVNVCILTLGLAEKLFPYQDPLDEAVRIGASTFQVIGIIGRNRRDPSNQISSGRTWDDEIYLPLATSTCLFGETTMRRSSGSFSAERVELHRIILQAAGTEAVEPAARVGEALLRRFHEKKDYEMVVPLRMLEQAEQTKRLFNRVLGAIAAISLLVGGIGIMNIMMATVTERTREIGIRRALGAKRRDIVAQFLVETVVLSLGGGLIGVAVGIFIPFLVSRLTSMYTIVTPWSLVLAFGISGLVGVVFGLYPASQAARLDPIEALRHE